MGQIMQTVVRGLVAGLGVEDIAVREGMDVQTVRDMVLHLRATGRMAQVVAARRMAVA